MTKRMKSAHKRPKIIVKATNNKSVMDAELMAFVTSTARKNQYDPDEDPVIRDFRKRMGFVKISSK